MAEKRQRKKRSTGGREHRTELDTKMVQEICRDNHRALRVNHYGIGLHRSSPAQIQAVTEEIDFDEDRMSAQEDLFSLLGRNDATSLVKFPHKKYRVEFGCVTMNASIN